MKKYVYAKATIFLMGMLMFVLLPIQVKAADTATGPVDILSITKYVSQDGWSWDPATKTLTLAGVNMNGYQKYSYTENEENKSKPYSKIYNMFELPRGTTVVVKEGTENVIRSRVAGSCFCVSSTNPDNSTEGITFTGGGTLNLYMSEICVYGACDITFKDVNVNFIDADISIMSDSNPITDRTTGKKTYKDTTITMDHANVKVDNCTGGFYTYGKYVSSGQLQDDNILATSSICIKDSKVDMNVKLDTGNERNHHCMLIRNGYLNVENSTLNLQSYHEAVVVWRQYHLSEEEESLIRLKECTLQKGLKTASANLERNNSNVRAETLIQDGGRTSFSFNSKGMSFGHTFTNAVKQAVITAFPVYTVSFDSLGGSAVQDKFVVCGRTLGELPVPTKQGYEFVGWSTKKGSSTPDVSKDMVIAGDIKCYAIWKLTTSNPNANHSNKGVLEEQVKKTITSTNTDKKDVGGSKFGGLMLKATGKKKAVKLDWKRVSGAKEYVIYGSLCGSKMKELITVGGNKKTHTFKKLKSGKYYKYMVVAYKIVDGKRMAVSISKSVHAATTGKKYGNPTSISGVKKSISIKVKGKKQLKPTLKSKKKVKTHIAKFRYESSNSKIATVSKKGVITGKSKGNCTIYIYTQNGLCKKVKVKVKK